MYHTQLELKFLYVLFQKKNVLGHALFGRFHMLLLRELGGTKPVQGRIQIQFLRDFIRKNQTLIRKKNRCYSSDSLVACTKTLLGTISGNLFGRAKLILGRIKMPLHSSNSLLGCLNSSQLARTKMLNSSNSLPGCIKPLLKRTHPPHPCSKQPRCHCSGSFLWWPVWCKIRCRYDLK